MTVPPVVGSSEATPAPKRYIWGWVLLVLLIGFIALGEFVGSVSKPKTGMEPYSQEFRALLDVAKEKQSPATGSIAVKVRKQKLAEEEKLIKKAEAKIGRSVPTSGDAVFRTQARAERSEAPLEVDLKAIRASTVKGYGTFADLYSKPGLTKVEADKLLKELPPDWPNRRLIKIQVYERLGDKSLRAGLYSPGQRAFAKVTMAIAGMILIVGSLTLIVFLSMTIGRSLTPLGQPYLTLSKSVGDLLAAKAAQMLAAVLLVQVVVGVVALLVKGDARTWLSIAANLCVVPTAILVAKLPMGDRVFSLQAMGISKENFSRNVVWGLAGFAAELPVTLGVSVLGTKIFSFLPTPTHPMSEAISASHSPLVVVYAIIGAAVVAPFWEELMFRGYLFSALRPFFKSVVPAIILSSLAFASMHPQGPGLWLGLAAVGGASCILAHYSKSLVPSIVMHACHNLAVVMFALSQT